MKKFIELKLKLKSTDGVNNLINENIKVFDIKTCTKFILSNEFDYHRDIVMNHKFNVKFIT